MILLIILISSIIPMLWGISLIQYHYFDVDYSDTVLGPSFLFIIIYPMSFIGLGLMFVTFILPTDGNHPFAFTVIFPILAYATIPIMIIITRNLSSISRIVYTGFVLFQISFLITVLYMKYVSYSSLSF